MTLEARLCLVLVAATVGGCSRPRGFAKCTPPVINALDLPTAQARYPRLSDLCLVDTAADQSLTINPSATAYELTTPLFSDYALKDRAVWMPPGHKATYSADQPFTFPIGTFLVKSFSFAPDLTKPTAGRYVVETRVLVNTTTGWLALPYVWNADKSEALLDPAGSVSSFDFTSPDGTALHANYLLPSSAQCQQCHITSDVMHPIGPKARLLNRDHVYADGSTENQLDRWSRLGLLDGAPPSATAPRLATWDDPTSGTVEERARAWLETNCAHCHNQGGLARTTGLFLGIDEPNPGVCKSPVAAGQASGGFRYDVVPGQPENSILVFRIESTKPAIMMPEVGRSVVETEATKLIRDWIAGLPIVVCQ